MFNWLYYLKIDLFDQDIEKYFKLNLQNVTDVGSVNIFTILYFSGKINLKEIGEDCMQESINYGNDSLTIWLLS